MPTSVSTTSSEEDCFILENRALDIAKMGFPDDDVNLIKQAIDDPSVISPDKLVEIARTVCIKAFEKSVYSYPISSILITVCDKDNNQLFTQSLINCCREWFNKRQRLRPGERDPVSPKKHRWSAYVAFITDFYLNLKSKLRGVKLKDGLDIDSDLDGDAESDIETDQLNVAKSDYIHLEFVDLLYDCCSDIVNILDTTNTPTSEIECLLNVLRTVGKHMELDRPQRMVELVSQLRIAFIGPVSTRLPDRCVKSVLEIIECAASGWTFDSSQAAYYYPSLS